MFLPPGEAPSIPASGAHGLRLPALWPGAAVARGALIPLAGESGPGDTRTMTSKRQPLEMTLTTDASDIDGPSLDRRSEERRARDLEISEMLGLLLLLEAQ